MTTLSGPGSTPFCRAQEILKNGRGRSSRFCATWRLRWREGETVGVIWQDSEICIQKGNKKRDAKQRRKEGATSSLLSLPISVHAAPFPAAPFHDKIHYKTFRLFISSISFFSVHARGLWLATGTILFVGWTTYLIQHIISYVKYSWILNLKFFH